MESPALEIGLWAFLLVRGCSSSCRSGCLDNVSSFMPFHAIGSTLLNIPGSGVVCEPGGLLGLAAVRALAAAAVVVATGAVVAAAAAAAAAVVVALLSHDGPYLRRNREMRLESTCCPPTRNAVCFPRAARFCCLRIMTWTSLALIFLRMCHAARRSLYCFSLYRPLASDMPNMNSPRIRCNEMMITLHDDFDIPELQLVI